MRNTDGEFSGIDFLKRLRFRWHLALTVFAAMFACVALGVMLLPNKYEARFKVVVKNDRIDPMLGADKQTQSILNVNDISEPRINTEIQLLTSSKVLLDVVNNAGLAEQAKGKGKSQGQQEEAALRQLQKQLVVTPVRNSNVIEVSYESTDAHRSTQVVKAVWESYKLANRAMHGVPGSLGFFEHLSSQYDAQLAAAQDELTTFRRTHDIVSLPEEQSLALNNAARLRGQIADSSAEERKSSAAATRLKHEIDSLPASVERDRRSVPNHALIQQLTTALVSLQNRKAEASLRYQSGDRLLKDLDADIARTESALVQAKKTASEEVSVAANPAMDVARGEYIRMAAVGAGAQAQTAELARQMGKDHARLSALTADSAIYKQLLQKVTELEELDQSYHKKTDEARFEQMLDDQQISNLALLDEPFTSALPSSPKRGLFLSLGFFWSIFIAFAVTAATEAIALGRDHARPASSTVPVKLPPATELETTVPVPAKSPAPMPAYAGLVFAEASQSITEHAKENTFDITTAEKESRFVSSEQKVAAPTPILTEAWSKTSTFRSPSELFHVVEAPLLATVPAGTPPPNSASFSALYLSVQRGETSVLKEVRR